MPHLADAPTPFEPSAGPGRWVRCRARTWRVLDARREEDTLQWRLSRGTGLPHLFASPPDRVAPAHVRTRRVSRRAWGHHVLSVVRAACPVWWPRLAPALPLDRLAYQYVPSMTLLSGHHRRLLLADAVGLGKTMQAAMLLHEVHAREADAATLVVVPAALLGQWHRELRERVRIDASILDTDALRREASLPRHVVDASRRGMCCLISIDLLRQPEVTSLITSVSWTVLVVDEAHLAAPGTARLDAVARVAAVSVRVLLMTATPTAGGEDAADELRRIGRRRNETPMLVLSRRASAGVGLPRRTRRLVVESSHAEAALHDRLDRYAARARTERGPDGLLPALVLRRRAASCPAALARSLARRLEVLGSTGSPPMPSLFDACADDESTENDALRAVAWDNEGDERRELERLLCMARSCEPAGRKGATLARLVRRCREPVVVFTAYVDTLRALRRALAAHALVVVHGRMPDALRGAAIDAFTRGDADVLLTTDASAEGLNLHQRCRLVVHADVPVSSRLFTQRTGRVDRHGQTRRVHAVVFATATSHDTETWARLRERQDGEDRWIAAAAAAGDRRTAVAGRLLERHATSERQSASARAGRAPGGSAGRVMIAHSTSGRTWERLARGLALPVGARARCVTVGILHAGGTPLLTQGESVVALAHALPQGRQDDGPVAAAAWPALCRAQWVRARRLVARLARWEAEAEQAVRAEWRASSPSPDLFADATDGRVASPRPKSRDGRLSCAFSPTGVLERRS